MINDWLPLVSSNRNAVSTTPAALQRAGCSNFTSPLCALQLPPAPNEHGGTSLDACSPHFKGRRERPGLGDGSDAGIVCRSAGVVHAAPIRQRTLAAFCDG